MDIIIKAKSRVEDSRYLGSIFDQETRRIDHYLLKALDKSLPLKSRVLGAKIAAALLEVELLNKENLPE